LRDGKLVGAYELAKLERLDLVCLMLGKQRDELQRKGATAFKHHGTAPEFAPLLRAEKLKRGRKLNGVTVEAGRGEIVGIAGLLGSGRTETARAIFGADRIETGTVYLEDMQLNLREPNDAINAGLAFISEDRKAEGIIPELSVRENLTLPRCLRFLRWASFRARARMRSSRALCSACVSKRRVPKDSRAFRRQSTKVLLARWLCKIRSS
jgi:ribose transport system ATP-binding protein